MATESDGIQPESVHKSQPEMQETMIDTFVTYTLDHQGILYVIEHVPARVYQETGEEYFAPETVEHITQCNTRILSACPANPTDFDSPRLIP